MVMECCYTVTNNTVGQKLSHHWMIWSAKDLIKSMDGFIMLSSPSIESINTFITSIYAFIGSMNQSYQSRDILRKNSFSKKCWETQFLFIGKACKMFIFLKYIFSIFYNLFSNTIRKILLKNLKQSSHLFAIPSSPSSETCTARVLTVSGLLGEPATMSPYTVWGPWKETWRNSSGTVRGQKPE